MLNTLIAKYCPSGVTYVKLGDFATQWYRGAGIKKDEVCQEGIPCIRYGEIHTTYKLWFDKCVSHTDEANQPSKKYADYGDILFAITSEDIPFIGNSVAYMGKERILVGGDIVVMKHKQNPKYISYALSTNDAIQQKGKGRVKSKVVHTNVPSLKEIIIPLPPLPIQEEIVRMLDAFTELQAELQAELQKRFQQYNYFRDNLLSFEGRRDMEWLTIEQLFHRKNGYTPSKSNPDFWNNGTIPWFRMEDIRENGRVLSNSIQKVHSSAVKRNSLIKAGSIILATSATIGEHALVKVDCLTNQRFTCLTVKDEYRKKVDIMFLFYYMFKVDEWCKTHTVQGNFPGVDMSQFPNVKIPIPSLEEQVKIASILNRFDTLTNDLTAGLPAEIEKRRQQYEYYRDKLLTFKRKEA